MVLYKVHSIPMSSITVTRQLGVVWDFSGGNIWYWYGAEPYQCHFVKYGECMGFCQIRSNSIEKDNGNYKWVSYGKPCPIPIPCTAHSSAIDHTIPFPNLGHVWSISNIVVLKT